MDCKTARLLLEFARPRLPELESAEAAALEVHLGDCPDCAALARAGQLADTAIASAMVAVPVPEGLRERVLARLESERARPARARPRFNARVLTAAAVILLATALGFSLFASRRPTLYLDDPLAMALEVPTTPEAVEAWFAANHGIRTAAPTGFNCAWLVSCAIGEIEGKQVPVLVFVRQQAHVRVYILSSRQFDIAGSLEQPPFSTGGYTVEIRAHPTNPRYAYLIVYKGGALDLFLLGTERGAT